VRRREKWKPLLAVAVVIVGVLVYVGQDRWRDRCGAQAESLSADDVGAVLEQADDLADDLAKDREYESCRVGPELLDTLDGLASPFGSVTSGRVFGGPIQRATTGEVDDESVYLAAGWSPSTIRARTSGTWSWRASTATRDSGTTSS
jgi:hypothetical protein